MIDWDNLGAVSLHDFMESDSLSEYVKYKDLYAVMYKKDENICGLPTPCLGILQITSSVRPDNIVDDPAKASTGQLREFCHYALEQAGYYNFEAVMFKCVINPFMARKLEEYGYLEISNAPCHSDYYKYW